MPFSGIKEPSISGLHLFDIAVALAQQTCRLFGTGRRPQGPPRLPPLANAVYHLWYAQRAGVSTGLFRCGGY
jgi:hypothetical protein